jgi:hypothetical protein
MILCLESVVVYNTVLAVVVRSLAAARLCEFVGVRDGIVLVLLLLAVACRRAVRDGFVLLEDEPPPQNDAKAG